MIPEPQDEIELMDRASPDGGTDLLQAAHDYNLEDRKHIYWVVESPFGGFLLVRKSVWYIDKRNVQRAKNHVASLAEEYIREVEPDGSSN